MKKFKPFSFERPCYTLASQNGVDAELTLYGEIMEYQPRDLWGDPIEGEFILQDEFLRDLEAVKNCSSLHIRINSAGGDAAVSVLIHNRLRELAMNGMKLSCTVDGVAMSGGSLIMCACENVRVYPSSIIMIHKCWSLLFGGYNADELREAATRQDAIDRAQVGIYAQKTGLSETQLLHMMGDTTYMTGKDAIEKGFADVLVEGDVEIAASADGRRLFVGGREMHLTAGMFAPDFVRTSEEEPHEEDGIDGEDPEDIDHQAGEPEIGRRPTPEVRAMRETSTAEPETDPAVSPGNPGSEGGEDMTLEEFREQNPEEARRIDEAQAAAVRDAENRARAAERERLRGIDGIAATVGDPAMVEEARYGETACDARELAFRAMQRSAAQGASAFQAMRNDAQASGAAAVNPVPPVEDKPIIPKTADEQMNAARAEVKSLLHPEQ